MASSNILLTVFILLAAIVLPLEALWRNDFHRYRRLGEVFAGIGFGCLFVALVRPRSSTVWVGLAVVWGLATLASLVAWKVDVWEQKGYTSGDF